MKLILNEQYHIDKALNEGYIDKKPSITLSLLAKYYFSIEMDKKQVFDSLESFMKDNYPDFNEDKWDNTIKKIIKRVQNKEDYTILQVDAVNITKSEIQSIESVGNDKLERLAFVLLVYSKIFNQINNTNEYWVNEETKNLFSDCKLCAGREEQDMMINRLFDVGMIKLAHKVDSNGIKIEFANEDSEIMILVNNFIDFIYYWLNYKGESIKKCEDCGDFFQQKSNRQKFCKKCWKEKQLKWQRNSMKKIRM